MNRNTDKQASTKKPLNKKEFILKVVQTAIAGFIFVLCITALLSIFEDSNISPGVRLDRYGLLVVSNDEFPHVSMDYSPVNNLTNKEVVKGSNELCSTLTEKFNEKDYNAFYDITYYPEYKMYVMNIILHCKDKNIREDLPGIKWNFIIDTINTECESWYDTLLDSKVDSERNVTVYFNMIDLDNKSAILFSSKNGSTTFDGLN